MSEEKLKKEIKDLKKELLNANEYYGDSIGELKKELRAVKKGKNKITKESIRYEELYFTERNKNKNLQKFKDCFDYCNSLFDLTAIYTHENMGQELKTEQSLYKYEIGTFRVKFRAVIKRLIRNKLD